ARGTWFFEGSFPVVLTNWDGLIIAEGVAQAKGDWMTEDFVDFSVTLEFTGPQLYNRGSLILMKDNPSGLPQNDDAFEVTVEFADAQRKSGE
ncbi:MAG: Gmad2 immunoglobulin-like domain-containing protein, partial [Candidatus Magasanikbacteria bacterium]|nr:Gmad2 immunoglobulin-like domain-containing protein [Candidatus Magasanikbacteria bacterium]